MFLPGLVLNHLRYIFKIKKVANAVLHISITVLRSLYIIFRAFLASDEKNYQSKVNFGRLRPLRYQKTEKFKQPSNFLFNLLLCDTFYPLTQRNKSVVYEIDTRMKKIGKSVDQWHFSENQCLGKTYPIFPILPNFAKCNGNNVMLIITFIL